jgi:succinyl-diaminopimelate desuccinylase
MTKPIATTPIAAELAELTLQLCKIPSETRFEKEIADWVERRCRELAPDADIHRIGNSVVCDPRRARGREAGLPVVGLVGHLDTVKCAVNQRFEVADDRVYGCGATDMKAGVAVMLKLLERWQEWDAAEPIWIFYDQEEGPYELNGLEPVLESGVLPEMELAFVLEPTDGTVQYGCMGGLNATVTVPGRRSHSARPWQGENALFRAVPLLERLAAWQRREVAFGELTFYEVIVPTQANTSNSKNVVPDALVMNVNVRFAPGRTVDDAFGELRELVGEDAHAEIVDASPAGEVFLDHPLLEPWREREGLARSPKQAWTDVARLTAHGIPAVNFGPGETSQAHQADEWASIASLEQAYGALARFLARG